ncbi:MAG: hypothetical protein KBT03_13760 [Bacteroidales bacterium]|nr:hypothetical protein [Candidatus Scybalousia scybalohippi]
MSKSKKVSYDMTPYNNYMDYLKSYDTSNVDNTLNNLTTYANSASQNLADAMGNYNFSVDGSDDARQRAEQAQFNSYMNYMQPQFEQQTSDLATALQNKGLAVGSEAYERAMNDLQDNQNQAINQASYNAVNAGQNAFSQSLADSINAGNFGNTAQQNYINQLLSALTGSASGYENQQNIFSTGVGKSNAKFQQDQANASAKNGLTNTLISAGAGLAGNALGGPIGGLLASKLASSMAGGSGGTGA